MVLDQMFKYINLNKRFLKNNKRDFRGNMYVIPYKYGKQGLI